MYIRRGKRNFWNELVSERPEQCEPFNGPRARFDVAAPRRYLRIDLQTARAFGVGTGRWSEYEEKRRARARPYARFFPRVNNDESKNW